MKIQIITLFPEMFEGVLNSSMLWKAQKEDLVEYKLINLRDFGIGPRKTVDDTPYGGGDGMVLRPEPLFSAVEAAKETDPDAQVLLMTPRGDLFTQELAREFAATEAGLIIICGRYEGYDERITTIVDKQISVGNFVLTGGELPAMIVADAVTRLVPGVLGGETSAELESFSQGGEREHPHYTRPEEFRGLKVPDVLLSGNHSQIANWREENKK
ncbi:MAG TPA: tRNA (guanosine(37)-N1)-methyltransferase TrmD [Candidatus Saccharimonadales bacterium]|nr:tRNA (guanosine(37)-N1)-methyltransferase TrmD [Candidatus Saccharimonadales bacterium]